jgi:hypothetical protein
VALPAGFTISAGMDCGDVDAATSVQFSFNYPACQATATAWGFSAMDSVITLVPPANTGELVASGTPITTVLLHSTYGDSREALSAREILWVYPGGRRAGRCFWCLQAPSG